MRVLITLTPSMYREAVAHSVRQHRPGLEVRIAPPEAVEQEVRAFEPHLLVRNDTDWIGQGSLHPLPVIDDGSYYLAYVRVKQPV
jgi:hypothetical protein